MAITRAQVTTIQELAAWMQENAVPNIFKSVTIDNNNNITATDDEDNVCLYIKNGYGGYFRAYSGESSYASIGMQYVVSRSAASDVIGCDNGFMVSGKVEDSSYNQKDFAFLCAKTNNGKPAIIFQSDLSRSGANVYTQTIHHIAFGDTTSTALFTTTTFTPEAAQQTIMCGFGTNADITDVSYTPKAFYMPMHSAYNQGIGKFLCGGKVYITNGYWAIDSEEDAT